MLKQDAVTYLLPPFSVSTKDRTLPFTKEMEMAAVFLLAESYRRKGEGIILKKPVEELAFILNSCYPIWLAPWNSTTLFFDGLGISTCAIRYDVLPDVKAFIDEIEGSSERYEAYKAALSDRSNYFQSAEKTEEKTVQGLIPSQDFVQDFKKYLDDAEEVHESRIKEEMCLSPTVAESTISLALDELSTLKATLEKDVQNLRAAMKLINASTGKHTEAIRESARKTQADLNERLTATKSSAMKRVREIQEKYDEKISKSTQRFDKQLQVLHQERVKLERTETRAFDQVQRCEAEIETSKRQKDSAGERRWKEEKEKWKREISALKKDISSLNKQMEQTGSQKRIETINLRAEFKSHSEEAMKDVRELEALKESKMQLSRQEIDLLEELSSTFLGQLGELVKHKKASLEQLDGLGFRESRRKIALAYAPFYLSCFQSGGQRMYLVHSPSLVGTVGVMTKFKSMFGASKVKTLFQPRSKAIANVLNQIITLIERDPVFERDVYEDGKRANILGSAESREKIVKGLEELRNEEWISMGETQAFSTSLRVREPHQNV